MIFKWLLRLGISQTLEILKRKLLGTCAWLVHDDWRSFFLHLSNMLSDLTLRRLLMRATLTLRIHNIAGKRSRDMTTPSIFNGTQELSTLILELLRCQEDCSELAIDLHELCFTLLQTPTRT